jgi:hypothetical protein
MRLRHRQRRCSCIFQRHRRGTITILSRRLASGLFQENFEAKPEPDVSWFLPEVSCFLKFFKILTCDSVTVSVDAVVYFNVIDAEQALCSVDDFRWLQDSLCKDSACFFLSYLTAYLSGWLATYYTSNWFLFQTQASKLTFASTYYSLTLYMYD